MYNKNDELFSAEELTDELEASRAVKSASPEAETARKTLEALLEGRLTDSDDEKLTEAAIIAVTMGKISTSIIQRRLNVGYGRAAKMIDRLEELGVITEPHGTRPRLALIDCKGERVTVENADACEKETVSYDEIVFGVREREEQARLPEGFVPHRKPCKGDFEGADELLITAAYMAADEGRIASSMLQRRLSVGYGRAANIIDRLEEIGVVAPPCRNAPRASLVSRDQLERIVDEIK